MLRPLRKLIPLLLASLITATKASDSRPNILWIFVEDLSPYIGCYGDPVNKGHTPTLDRMAAEGVLFTRAFVSAPVCSASRSAIITGVMQTTTGTHLHRSSRWPKGPVPEKHRIHLPESLPTIPELMRDAGYFTFNCGKDDYNFHYDRRKLYEVGTEKDYVVGQNGWQGNKSEDFQNFATNTWKARKDKDQPWFGQIMLWGGKAGAKHVRRGDKLADDAVPLPPYFPDTPAHRASWTTHYNAVRGTDAQVQVILDLLEADGELDRTLVFFFSDHGNNQSLRHKQFCYEGGVHVPVILIGKHPGFKVGTVHKELVSSLDIPATTLAFAGVGLPDHLDGQDLFSQDYQPREFVISARDRCDYTIDRIRTVRTDKFRYLRNYHPDRALLQAQYRDNWPTVRDLRRLHESGDLNPVLDELWFGTRPEEELYDLAADPHQMRNLANHPEFAAELKRHRAILDKWTKETDDQGQYPESPTSLKPTYELWKDKPIFKEAKVNPEYDQFRK